MAINPCCMPLQRGVTIMAVIDVVLSTITLIITTLALIAVSICSSNNDTSCEYTDGESDVAIGTYVVLTIIAFLGLLLSLRLYFGAKSRDIRNCKIWLIVKIILFIIDIITVIINATNGDVNTQTWVITCINWVYRIYMMYCVYCFIQEMKMDQQLPGFQARLEGGVVYSMQTFPEPPQNQQQPTVYIHQDPYPYSQSGGGPPPYQNQGPPPNGGLYNPNNQYHNNTADSPL